MQKIYLFCIKIPLTLSYQHGVPKGYIVGPGKYYQISFIYNTQKSARNVQFTTIYKVYRLPTLPTNAIALKTLISLS